MSRDCMVVKRLNENCQNDEDPINGDVNNLGVCLSFFI